MQSFPALPSRMPSDPGRQLLATRSRRSPTAAARPCAARRRSSLRFARAPRPARLPTSSPTSATCWTGHRRQRRHARVEAHAAAAWTDDVARFFAALERFDARLADEAPARLSRRATVPGPHRRRDHPRRPARPPQASGRRTQYAARTTSERASRWDMWACAIGSRCSSSTSPIGRGARVLPSRPLRPLLEAECGFARRCWL
jgi:hypothetical protein